MRTARRWPVGPALLSVLFWLVPTPASAHEFLIVVVEAGPAASTDAGRGFRLAIDQSPDISHPPGEDGGDHLGGIDVDVVTVDARSGDRATRQGVARALDEGASVVVVLSDSRDVMPVADVAAGRTRLVIAATPPQASVSRAHVVALLARPPESQDRERVDSLAVAFTEVFGAPPTDAAMRGYDAGVLLDELVGDLGDTLVPGDRLSAALGAASSRLVGSTPELGRSAPSTGDRGEAILTPARVMGAGVAITLAIAVAAVTARRRRRPADGARHRP